MLKKVVYPLYAFFFSACAALGQYTTPAAGLNFNGKGLSETSTFTIGARWTAHWDAFIGDVTVEDSSGAIVAGVSAAGSGSIFVPTAGTYKLHIAPLTADAPWNIHIGEIATAVANTGVPGYYSPPEAAQTAVSRSGNVLQPTGNNLPQAAPPPSSNGSAPVALLNGSGEGKMTQAQAAAVVLIHGDKAEGTGFMVKTASGPVVITNQHVIGANPHLVITTATGAIVKILGLVGASDRDLAMISIQDNNYSYLELATDVSAVAQMGDEVITPGNSQAGGVLLNTLGKVNALGPQKVEISNPVFHGNSGGPIFHVKSGKVIGVVTEGQKVDSSDPLDQASLQNSASAISGTIRYFGLRLDNVPSWQNYTWTRFENETTFLHNFDERSRCLDSYLNTGQSDTSEWGLYYLNDDKLKNINQAIDSTMGGDDASTRMDAARDIVFSLDGVAESDMVDIQQPTNFYSFDQIRAKREVLYRQALEKEINDMKDNLDRLGGLARHTN